MAGLGRLARRARARSQAALVQAIAGRKAILNRLAWQLAELRANLDKIAVANAAMAAALAGMEAFGREATMLASKTPGIPSGLEVN